MNMYELARKVRLAHGCEPRARLLGATRQDGWCHRCRLGGLGLVHVVGRWVWATCYAPTNGTDITFDAECTVRVALDGGSRHNHTGPGVGWRPATNSWALMRRSAWSGGVAGDAQMWSVAALWCTTHSGAHTA